MNQVNLIGRITKELELKTTANGKNYCFITLAINEYSNSDKKHTNFINCIAWEKNAINLTKYVKKGNLLAVEGSINIQQQNNNGTFTNNWIVKVARIEFLSPTTNKNNQVDNLGESWKEAQTNTSYKIEVNNEEIADESILWED